MKSRTQTFGAAPVKRPRGRPPTRVLPLPGSPEYTVGCKGSSGERYDHNAECRRQKKVRFQGPAEGPGGAPSASGPSPGAAPPTLGQAPIVPPPAAFAPPALGAAPEREGGVRILLTSATLQGLFAATADTPLDDQTVFVEPSLAAGLARTFVWRLRRAL